MPDFAIIGAAGYIAPKHMQAIRDVGGNLVAAMDPHESVGVLDRFFPDCEYFSDFGAFDSFIADNPVDFVSICSPTYLHVVHCKWAMRAMANVICEKPLVLTLEELDCLKFLEEKTGKRVWTVLQLRYHPLVAQMQKYRDSLVKPVQIDYATPRGNWYHSTWKTDPRKSGGLATNIGIHLFDLAVSLFGMMVKEPTITYDLEEAISGTLQLHRANLEWSLSIGKDWKARRSFQIGSEKFELSGSFTELHTEVYRQVLAGNGIGLDHVRESVRITEAVRKECNGSCPRAV